MTEHLAPPGRSFWPGLFASTGHLHSPKNSWFRYKRILAPSTGPHRSHQQGCQTGTFRTWISSRVIRRCRWSAAIHVYRHQSLRNWPPAVQHKPIYIDLQPTPLHGRLSSIFSLLLSISIASIGLTCAQRLSVLAIPLPTLPPGGCSTKRLYEVTARYRLSMHKSRNLPDLTMNW